MAVSLALRDDESIPAATRQKIKKVADELGYRPDPIVARVLSGLRYQAEGGRVLAYIHNFPDDTWKSHIVIGRNYQGALQRAQILGYKVDDFMLHPKHITAKRLSNVLQNRGIKGLIFGGLQKFRGHLSLNLTPFSCVAMGMSIVRPQLHRIANHQIHSVQIAFRKLRHSGSRRIGLVIPSWLDARSEHNWHAGMSVLQLQLPKEQVVPSYRPVGLDKKGFIRWLEKFKVDGLLLLDDIVPDWLEEEKIQVPADIQIAHLDLNEHLAKRFSGIDQRHDYAGQAGVDVLLGEIYLNALGAPKIPRTILIEGQWINGPSTLS